MAAHWSRDKYVIWWRDKGTGRMRVSFNQDKDALLRRLQKVWHDDMDAALYDPTGERLPLRAPADPEKPKPKRKAKPKAVVPPAGAAVM